MKARKVQQQRIATSAGQVTALRKEAAFEEGVLRLQALEEQLGRVRREKEAKARREQQRQKKKVQYLNAVIIVQSALRRRRKRLVAHACGVLVSFLRCCRAKDVVKMGAWAARVLRRFAAAASRRWRQWRVRRRLEQARARLLTMVTRGVAGAVVGELLSAQVAKMAERQAEQVRAQQLRLAALHQQTGAGKKAPQRSIARRADPLSPSSGSVPQPVKQKAAPPGARVGGLIEPSSRLAPTATPCLLTDGSLERRPPSNQASPDKSVELPPKAAVASQGRKADAKKARPQPVVAVVAAQKEGPALPGSRVARVSSSPLQRTLSPPACPPVCLGQRTRLSDATRALHSRRELARELEARRRRKAVEEQREQRRRDEELRAEEQRLQQARAEKKKREILSAIQEAQAEGARAAAKAAARRVQADKQRAEQLLREKDELRMMRRCDLREDDLCERRRLAIQRPLAPAHTYKERGKQRSKERGKQRRLSDGSSAASLSDSSLSVDCGPAPETDDVAAAESAGDEGDSFTRFVAEEAAIAATSAAAERALQRASDDEAERARQQAQREYEDGLVRSRKLAQDRSDALLRLQKEELLRRGAAAAARQKMRVDVSAAAGEALRREQALQERRRERGVEAKMAALRNRKKKGLRNDDGSEIEVEGDEYLDEDDLFDARPPPNAFGFEDFMASPTAGPVTLSPLASPLRRRPPRDPRKAPRVDIPRALEGTPYYEDYKSVVSLARAAAPDPPKESRQARLDRLGKVSTLLALVGRARRRLDESARDAPQAPGAAEHSRDEERLLAAATVRRGPPLVMPLGEFLRAGPLAAAPRQALAARGAQAKDGLRRHLAQELLPSPEAPRLAHSSSCQDTAAYDLAALDDECDALRRSLEERWAGGGRGGHAKAT